MERFWRQTQQAVLTLDSFSWGDRGQTRTLALEDVLGVSDFEVNADQSSGTFWLHACPKQTWPQAGRQSSDFYPDKHRRRLIRFRFSCAVETGAPWIQAIRSQLKQTDAHCVAKPGSHLLVFINPTSGRRQGQSLFTRVRAILECKGVKLTTIQLTSINLSQRGSIQTVIAAIDFQKIDGLVCVGGDGTVYQILNGLMARSDWQTVINLPLGILPAGSSNGLCQTLLDQRGEAYDPVNAAFLIAKGESCPIDIFKVNQPGQIKYGLLSVAWALISDIDIGSDPWRILGPLRSDFYALLKILRLKPYRGHLAIHQVAIDQASIEPVFIEGDVVALWAMNVAWASFKVKAAPQAQICDGMMDLLLIRAGITRWQLLQAFMQVSTGGHVNFSQVESYKTQGFELKPIHPFGIIAVDGERVASTTTQVEVLKGLGRVIAFAEPSPS